MRLKGKVRFSDVIEGFMALRSHLVIVTIGLMLAAFLQDLSGEKVSLWSYALLVVFTPLSFFFINTFL